MLNCINFRKNNMEKRFGVKIKDFEMCERFGEETRYISLCQAEPDLS